VLEEGGEDKKLKSQRSRKDRSLSLSLSALSHFMGEKVLLQEQDTGNHGSGSVSLILNLF
jgi:hypothetical protein